MRDEGAVLSPASQAMVNGHYRFIYLTTHIAVNKKVCTAQDKQNVIVIERDGAQQFFGLIFDYYEAARVALQVKSEMEKQEKKKIATEKKTLKEKKLK